MEEWESLTSFSQREKLVLGLIISVFFISLGIAYFSSRETQNTVEICPLVTLPADLVGLESEKTGLKEETIKVHVSGAVNEPGVIEINADSRLEDCIRAAGGFSAQVSGDYVKQEINLARRLVDGEKIYIPSLEEIQKQVEEQRQGHVSGADTGIKSSRTIMTTDQSGSNSSMGKININTASLAQLESLSGIGPVYGQRIIEGRPYSRKEEITKVKGIGPKTYEAIKGQITVQ